MRSPRSKDATRPTLDDLARANEAFLANEPRDLFYRVATELIALAQRQETTITVSEALAVLLQTWNRVYYQYHPAEQRTLPDDLDALLEQFAQPLATVRERSIKSFSADDAKVARQLFEAFASVLGPVGAAKALHLLAPRYFPLWDAAIRKGYGANSSASRRDADCYLQFMEAVQRECEMLGGEGGIGRNPLKALDEFNYCHYSRGWL
jgi:hypothetical protein